MANHSSDQECPARGAAGQTGMPAVSEPPVRRWPHPVDGVEAGQVSAAARQTDSALHYIRCALSYQNQLLADIKALLEQIAEDPPESEPEK